MGEPKPKSKTNTKLRKAPTKPIAVALTPTGPVMEAIAIFKPNLVPFVAGTFALIGGNLVLAIVGMFLGPLGLIFNGLSILYSAFISANLTQMALDAHDRKPVAIGSLTAVHPNLVNYLATSFVVTVVMSIGFVLFLIPGIIALALLGPALPLVLDKQTDPVSALQRSVAIAKPHLMPLALIGLVLGVLNFVGTIPLGLGLLATMPITLIAMACVYRSLDR